MNDLPDPLVPAGVDLRSFAFMPLDVVRLRDSGLAIEATGEEFRAAVLLWCASWHQVPAASLPDDDRALSLLAGFGRDLRTWKRLRPGATRGWVLCSDGRLYHPVVAAKALESAGMKEAAKRKRERDADRLRRWRETHDDTRDETRFLAERPERTGSDRTRPDTRGAPPSSSDHPPRTPDPAAATASKRISGVDLRGLHAALAADDLHGVVRAFGGNLAGDRPKEWLRDADGLSTSAVAVLLGWKRHQRAAVREPSGFRQALDEWRDQVSDEYRRDAAATVRSSLGMPHPSEVRP